MKCFKAFSMDGIAEGEEEVELRRTYIVMLPFMGMQDEVAAIAGSRSTGTMHVSASVQRPVTSFRCRCQKAKRDMVGKKGQRTAHWHEIRRHGTKTKRWQGVV